MTAAAADPGAGEVLVISDGTPSARDALWRAGLLASERRVPLRVLHVARKREPVPGAEALRAACEDLAGRFRVPVQAQVSEGELLQELRDAAHHAGVLVIGSARSNALREWISGTQAERLIRLCRVPTLVVKRTAAMARDAAAPGALAPGRYGRVLVPVDMSPEAGGVIRTAVRYSRDPRIEVFHALAAGKGRRSDRVQGPQQPRETAMQRAQSLLRQLVASSQVDPARAAATVGFGEPAASVLARERAIGAELIVIGKRQRGLLADFFLGGVTQNVLAGSQADVLVIPAGVAQAA